MIIKEAHDIESDLVEMRRHFHMHPETMYEEENTASYIENKLKNNEKCCSQIGNIQ